RQACGSLRASTVFSGLVGLPLGRARHCFARFWHADHNPVKAQQPILTGYGRLPLQSDVEGDDLIHRLRGQQLIHLARGLVAAGLADHPGRDTSYRLVVWNGRKNNRAGSDFRAVPNLDIAQNLRPCPNEHAIAYLGMTVAAGLPGASKGNAMQNRNVVLDHCRLTDHQPRGMVEEHTLADTRGRVDVGLEDRGGPALQIQREIPAALVPKPMRQAMRLNRMEALEVQHWHDEAVAGRIAVVVGLNIDAHDIRPGRIVRQHGLEGLADKISADVLMRQALGEAMNDRVLKALLVQNGGIEEGSQKRVAADGFLRLAADGMPDRVRLLQGT